MAGKPRLTEDQREEIEERRRAVAEAAAAEARAREEAWETLERERKEAEARRKSAEPSPEFVEAARRARERAQQERVELYRRAYEAEAKKRNPDPTLEKRFRDKDPEVVQRHLKAWAEFQDAMAGSDEIAKRETSRAMAHAWREKEEILLALTLERKRKQGSKKATEKARLTAEAELAREKIERLEKSKASAVKKPRSKKRSRREAS